MAQAAANERALPHDLEVEKSVLGAVLLDNHAFNNAAQVIGAQDFFSDANRLIFEAMAALSERGEAIDPVTLRSSLDRAGVLQRAGGPAYVSSLIDGLPSVANVEQYARLIKDKSARRQLIIASDRIIRDAIDGAADTDELLDRAEHTIFEISEGKVRKGFVSVGDLAVETMREIEDLIERGEYVTGVPTGFTGLDQKTAGLQKGDLVILAARPSMGKCLSADAEIVLQDGTVATIEQVVQSQLGPVATLGDDLRLEWAQPSAFVDDGMKPAFEVQTRLGRKVTTTLSHPFLTLSGWQRLEHLLPGDRIAVPRRLDVSGTEEMRDCEVKLLAYLIGDGGLTGTCPRFTNSNPRIAADFAEAIEQFGGVSIRRSSTRQGEAHGVSARAVAAHVGVSPATVTNWRQGVTNPGAEQVLALSEFLAVEPEALSPKGPDWLRTNQPNRLTSWLEKLGLMGSGASTKQIPDVIFRLRHDQLAMFLNRLFATDGWATVLRSGQAQLGYATVNERLARQVQHLLLRFGVISSLRQRWVKYREGRRVSWQLDVTDSRAITTFAETIGIFGKEDRLEAAARAASAKRYQTNRDLIPIEVWGLLDQVRGERSWRSIALEAGIPGDNLHVRRRAPTRDRLGKLASALDDERLEQLATSDVYWDEIVSIRAVGVRQVYDLTIPGTHNFVANDVCVHNTALALNIGLHVALEAAGSVGFFSLEMSTQQVIRRLITASAQVDAHKLSTGFLSQKDREKLLDALHRLSETKFFIDDSAAITALEMRAKARRLKAEHGLDLLIIDYLQLMRGAGRVENRNLEIGEISRSIKALAKELSVPVIALSQLSRAPESRSGHRPQLSDLRECVAGDTLVQLVDGTRVPIATLVGQQPEVVAVSGAGKLVVAKSDKVWAVGTRPVFNVVLRGRSAIRATGRHRLLTEAGWARVDSLEPGLGLLVTDPKVVRNVTRDRVVAIEPAGEEAVYDLTVPGPASWIANSIVSHNSGNLEQDADVVAFIFRPEVYADDPELEGVAELILAKQRNGPIGTVPLVFLKAFTLFKDRAGVPEEYA